MHGININCYLFNSKKYILLYVYMYRVLFYYCRHDFLTFCCCSYFVLDIGRVGQELFTLDIWNDIGITNNSYSSVIFFFNIKCFQYKIWGYASIEQRTNIMVQLVVKWHVLTLLWCFLTIKNVYNKLCSTYK